MVLNYFGTDYQSGSFGDDMFATVHLSKILCTPQDSVAMLSMLQAITLKR
ncbi:MAG TPA: hypothetical protein PLW09_02950 [Candidatus Kapabacteria bacterium]|nr:hypothetical protein [Ignavibacteria bacterium]HRE56754.1 hypothetical protein [Candidatus Kapabacteria bacterium]